MLFRRNPLKKYFRQVRKNTRREMREIRKIKDPAERLKRYGALEKGVQKLYNGGKPETIDSYGAMIGVVPGVMGGFAIGALVGVAIMALPTGTAALLAFLAGSALLGGIGGARLLGSIGAKRERKRLRAMYGSLRNARAIYRLKQTVGKKTTKEQQLVGSLRTVAGLQQQFDDATGKRTVAAAAPQPTAAQTPAQPTI